MCIAKISFFKFIMNSILVKQVMRNKELSQALNVLKCKW